MDTTKFGDIVGKTLVKIEGLEKGSELIQFIFNDDSIYNMFHSQDCCESVTIEDINGNIEDLLNTPILSAEESESNENPEGAEIPSYQDSFTWTFYRIITIKGTVVIRWYGESNGYYSESVYFEKVG